MFKFSFRKLKKNTVFWAEKNLHHSWRFLNFGGLLIGRRGAKYLIQQYGDFTRSA